MIREDLQRFKNIVEGRTIFIVGGGSSITDDMLKDLNKPNLKVFCVNTAVKYITNPIGLLWCDDSWVSPQKSLIDSYKFAKFAIRPHAANHPNGISNSIILNKTGEAGYDPDINNVKGNNSGGFAIHLLVNCKARQIVLVGFDMYSIGSKAHFHNEYTYPVRPSVYSDLFVPSITTMKQEMDKAQVKTEIFNINPLSALKCFEQRSLKEFI